MLYRKATLFFEIATLLCHEFNLFCRAEVLLPQWGSATRSGDTLLWCKVTLFFHIATLHWRKTILVFQKAMWLCAKTTLLFHEPTLLPDQDTLFRHNATQFQVQETLLFCGNTLFHHENTCFRGGVKSFQTGSTSLPDGYTCPGSRQPFPYLASVSTSLVITGHGGAFLSRTRDGGLPDRGYRCPNEPIRFRTRQAPISMQFSTVSSSLGPFPTQKLDFRPRPGARIEDEGLA